MEQYKVTGMSCAACSTRVEKAVSKLSGVKNCSVSLLTNSMVVEGDVSSDAVIEAVISAGYGAFLSDKKNTVNDNGIKDTETPVMKKRLISSLVFLTKYDKNRRSE